MSENKRKRLDEVVGEDDVMMTVPEETTTPEYLVERERFERYRIEKLLHLKKEKEANESRRKELELLENYLKGESEASRQLSTPQSKDDLIGEILQVQEKDNLISLNVGGKIFITTKKTIFSRENMLKVMLNSEFKIDRDENGCILLTDHNPDVFPIILEHIRTGSTTHVGLWETPTEESISMLHILLEESDFFGCVKLSQRVAHIISKYKPKSAEDDDEDVIIVSKPTKSNDTMATNQEEADAEWVKKFQDLTITEKNKVDNILLEEEEKLIKERKSILEKCEGIPNRDVTFNVRGVIFKINIEKIVKQPGFLLVNLLYRVNRDALQNNEIFIDRDPEIYTAIFTFLETGKTNCLPKEARKQKQIFKECKALNLQALLDFFDPMRFPIEMIGEDSLKIKEEEDLLRNLFAVDRSNPILDDPYLHLANVFENNNPAKLFQKQEPTQGPLLFDFENPVEASELSSRVRIPPVPKIVPSRAQFFTQFNAFTHGLFKDMDWNNVFVAGGSVVACALAVKIPGETNVRNCEDEQEILEDDDWDRDDEYQEEVEKSSDSDDFTDSDYEKPNYGRMSRAQRRLLNRNTKPSPYDPNQSLDQQLVQYYQNSVWNKSDIDIFLYGLTEQQAQEKIVYLFNLFKKNLNDVRSNYSVPLGSDNTSYHVKRLFEACGADAKTHVDHIDDILVTRTENSISFNFQNPIRPIQVILRIYKSPTEILMGFDIPCCCFGFNGTQLFCLPRAVKALQTRSNLVDPDRQSKTFEIRLIKYAKRGFRICCPGYDPKKIKNETLYNNECLYVSERYNRVRPKVHCDITKVEGLARILMVQHSLKHCRRSDRVFSAIKGTSSLTKTAELIEPSKNHDYAQVSYYGKYTVYVNYLRTKLKAQLVKEQFSKLPFFEFAFNSIEDVLHTDGTKSNLPPDIKWITIEPGRQFIGSFHPKTTSFFKDAYTPHKQPLRRKAKYTWAWCVDGNVYEDYGKEISRTIETAYRNYKKFGFGYSKYQLNDTQTINFYYNQLVDANGSIRLKRKKTAVPLKTRFEAVEIHEESSDDDDC